MRVFWSKNLLVKETLKMKGKHHGPEQIIRLLEEIDNQVKGGQRVEEICRRLEISVGTFWRWRCRYGGVKGQELKKLKDLERENTRLKKIVTELELDKAILREALEGKS
jgi:putative transposase